MSVSWKDFHRLCYVPWVEHVRQELKKVSLSDEVIKKIAEDREGLFDRSRASKQRRDRE